jgi:hypothetical protein
LANVTYTVVSGDSLWKISENKLSTILGSGIANTNANIQKAVDKLVELNDITNPNYIVIGQELVLSGAAKKSTSSNLKAVIKAFGLQSGTQSTLYATWTWNQSNTENYQVKWYYDSGNGVWFEGTNSTVTIKQSTYGIPSNAKRVKFLVKPVAKKRKVGNKEVAYWVASWSTEKIYDVSSSPPIAPSGAPEVTIDKYKLTARIEGLENANATSVKFEIVKDDSKVFKTGTGTIKTDVASFSCDVTRGCKYKVRCRTVRGKLLSEWTGYSANKGTIPYAPSKITECYVEKTDDTYIAYVRWTEVAGASYEIQWTKNENSFKLDPVDSSVSSKTSNIAYTEIYGLDSGEYYFRVRAVNPDITEGEKGSEWTPVRFAAAGSDPISPTTWSSVTTAYPNDTVTLYWVHNSEGGLKQTSAKILLTVNGVAQKNIEINSDDSSYDLPIFNYTDSDAKIEWAVQTAATKDDNGTAKYGDVSAFRTIDVYVTPTLTVAILENTPEIDNEYSEIDTLNAYPFYIVGEMQTYKQKAINANVSIRANNAYETVDDVGTVKMVNVGDLVYSKYFDELYPTEETAFLLEMTPGVINLENNISYTVDCVVYMDSGLTATAEAFFTVSWDDELLEPNAEIGIDPDTITASIQPFCRNSSGYLIEEVTLSVYRREYDGSFTEIATEIPNDGVTFVTDPHPALDFARYRVVARSNETGSIGYYDIPGIPVNENCVVIQWDEAWSNFDLVEDQIPEEPAWSGSMLKLPYNIDVSDDNGSDVELIEYIGRKHPVAYYGTQLGESATWNVTIDKNDIETLYALRRLRIWMGDVYVREPSGSGYWANIKVSFSQKHRDVTIPVTMTLTRVEGGI